MVIQGSRLKGSTILWLHHLEHLEHSPFVITAREKCKNISHPCLCASVWVTNLPEPVFSSQIIELTSCYYLWNTHISSSRPPLRDLFLLLWDNSIPFRHSIELKSSNLWIHNSPYIRCEYSLSWSDNFDVKIQVICFPTLPLPFNTHTQYSSRKGKL